MSKKDNNEVENKGSDVQKPSTAETGTPATAQMDLPLLRQMYGENSGTSGYKVLAAKPQMVMPEELSVQTWFNNCNNPASDMKELIERGTQLLITDVKNYNTLLHVFGYQGAEWSIHIGKILVTLKTLIRKSGQIWGVWAATNLKFVGERTREKMMRLAKRHDCWRYSILGPERLDVLCAAIPQSKDGTDAIGAFLHRHNIQFDPTHEFDLEEFKRQIDIALSDERLRNKGIVIPADRVAALVDNGNPVNSSLIKELATIQRSGGNLASHVDFLITSGGRDSSTKTPEQRLQDVNTLASRLTKSIDLILGKQDLIDLIDRDIYRQLIEKLNDISILRDMTTDYTKVAAQASN
jgi:hypothetical protein